MSTHNIHFQDKIIDPILSQLYYNISSYGKMEKSYLGLKNEFEIAVINEPSVFQPSKFQCNSVVYDSCKIGFHF